MAFYRGGHHNVFLETSYKLASAPIQPQEAPSTWNFIYINVCSYRSKAGYKKEQRGCAKAIVSDGWQGTVLYIFLSF